MRNQVIFASIIPAVRMFTGETYILAGRKAEDYPTAGRVEFYSDGHGGTTISIQTVLGVELESVMSDTAYDRFEEYAHYVDRLPIMGLKADHPIFRLAVSIKVESTLIELVEFNCNEIADRFQDK